MYSHCMLTTFLRAVVPSSWLTKAKRPLQWMLRCQRRVDWLLLYLRFPDSSFQHFLCNICNRHCSYPRQLIGRETPTCVNCGSTVRFRGIIHALSMELFGTSISITDFPASKGVVGAGLSDWSGYATRLTNKLDYTNTYYHKQPFLDISTKDILPDNQYDFLIASDVFEHVSQPISRAFENAFRILKPGGVFIFSVPFVEGETVEHFPELNKFSICREGSSWLLVNETTDGRTQRFSNLSFHGGPGTTVEMRVFGRDSLLRNLSEAGFSPVRLHAEQIEMFGILWNGDESGFDSQPWAARKP